MVEMGDEKLKRRNRTRRKNEMVMAELVAQD
jgi:hypothetical protein